MCHEMATFKMQSPTPQVVSLPAKRSRSRNEIYQLKIKVKRWIISIKCTESITDVVRRIMINENQIGSSLPPTKLLIKEIEATFL